ncbi:MAG: hypothetical protein QGG42_04155 [Phycisphaerae bacterium]|jgi:hypothetical protein|nr:hypothetical protein [Phycisphaerae bacterium]
MTPNELSQAIRTRLHPRPYYKDIQPSGGFDFMIMRSSLLVCGHYAFGFRQLGSVSVADAYRDAVSEARRLTKAIWLIREVGMYFMFCGPESSWRDHIQEGVTAKTGLHSLIVQAVHFVDPETGANHLNRSAWGSIKFGGLIPIPKMVEEVIGAIGEG